MNVSHVGEHALIRKIREQCDRTMQQGITGIGDDCAIFPLGEGRVGLLTTDLMIEGVHFTEHTTSMWELGAKVLETNVSDIAAMGGTPRLCTVAIAINGDMPLLDFSALYKGIVDTAELYGMVVIGGDTSRSPGPIFMAITVFGDCPAGTVLRRAGAKPGDLIYVSGDLGGSHIGLQWMLSMMPFQFDDTAGSDFTAAVDCCIQRHRLPKARVQLGSRLASSGFCTSCIDISDGLATDISHICTESEVGAEIELDYLPISTQTRQVAAIQSIDPVIAAATGGEDYELLFTITPTGKEALAALSQELSIPLTEVGRITTQSDDILFRKSGTIFEFGLSGYEHFRNVT